MRCQPERGFNMKLPMAAFRAILFLIGGMMAGGSASGESYEWGRIVSAEALSEKQASLQSAALTDIAATGTCIASLDYLETDPRMAKAELFILLDIVGEGHWLAYRGPVGPKLRLVVPAHLAQTTFSVTVSAEAIADDETHVISWTSYGSYPLTCGAGPSTLRLLDHFDMAGTGGNLHVLAPSE